MPNCLLGQQIIKDYTIINLINIIAEKCTDAYRNGNKTLLAGNGGSAADAQHIAAEFEGRLNFSRPPLPSIALTTNTSILTAIGNDYGFDQLFARQIEAQGTCGDVFIGISTSGNSSNIIEALRIAKSKKIITIGLTGLTGGEMFRFCDYCIKVPTTETTKIQEVHILIGHIICSIVEKNLFGDQFKN